ncbi:MAG: glutaredoxin family protein [Betaproteobacteria bacterium]|jgi:glutaredoxin|uniref:glutaredoxin family protein n=1 Tax=Thiomonas sp. TaxID=2047785 RepID=UPI000BDA396B|nr:glutaredoxin family protein [Thiomonas sp.]MDE2129449.1 glutaredoxin family protein [Betaproteobacteria bacterium]OZB44730.1 MAG: hypothetical protein B7X46_07320 [Thiomonas sp. 15-66-11]OZB61010.1 MAG: hypothetical protein B7X31_11170 [Thiomonas sp. 13-66-29]
MTPRPVFLATALAILLASPAWALYKIVGPDGQITFTDIPPSRPGREVQRLGAMPEQVRPGQGASQVPADLVPIVRKYPVVIYTTPQCPACEDGIKLLQQRGIPYTDKSISTAADIAAYKQISQGSEKLPLLTVAGVRLPVGYDQAAWNQALTAAGYPHQSRLPKDYRFGTAEPLVPAPAPKAPQAAGKASAPDQLPAVPVLPPHNPNAPPGFQF